MHISSEDLHSSVSTMLTEIIEIYNKSKVLLDMKLRSKKYQDMLVRKMSKSLMKNEIEEKYNLYMVVGQLEECLYCPFSGGGDITLLSNEPGVITTPRDDATSPLQKGEDRFSSHV